MNIDYAGIAARMEQKRELLDRQHPWEGGGDRIGQADLRMWSPYRIRPHLYRTEAAAVSLWNECAALCRAIQRFHRRHSKLHPLVCMTLLLRGEIRLPHPPKALCPRCDRIRALRASSGRS